MINCNKDNHEITFTTTITENDLKVALGNIRNRVSQLKASLEKRNEFSPLNNNEMKILAGVKDMSELLAPNGEIFNNAKHTNMIKIMHMDKIFDILSNSTHDNSLNIAGEIEAVCLDYIGTLNDTFAHIANMLGDLCDNYNEN